MFVYLCMRVDVCIYNKQASCIYVSIQTNLCKCTAALFSPIYFGKHVAVNCQILSNFWPLAQCYDYYILLKLQKKIDLQLFYFNYGNGQQSAMYVNNFSKSLCILRVSYCSPFLWQCEGNVTVVENTTEKTHPVMSFVKQI